MEAERPRKGRVGQRDCECDDADRGDDELAGEDLHRRTVTNDPGAPSRPLAERRKRLLAAELVEDAEPDACDDDPGMIAPSACSPTPTPMETTAATTSRPSSGLRSCAATTAGSVRFCDLSSFGPSRSSRAAASAAARPFSAGARAAIHAVSDDGSVGVAIRTCASSIRPAP